MHLHLRLLVLLATIIVAPIVPTSAEVWPEKDWAGATPESQGMSAAVLDAVEAYAQKPGGVSGCVVRFGTLVKEWGPATARADIKSAAKGAVGATLLGLAVDAGLVGLDERAQKHLPEIGTEPPGNSPEWLGEITLRHLATMTAGFDDGRPPRLLYRPSTAGIYSNDTANMLAELLTLRFDEDLLTVLKRRVLDPIGVDPADWRWRENRYRAKTLHGRTNREFASGITITHRALARIGYLYLRNGRWKGQTILSPSFIAAATRPTDLPAPYPYYGFYWGSNAKGTLPDVPQDIYWALGLGDSILVVCPSLDVVAVRLGTGNTQSQLPPQTDQWEQKVGGFFALVAAAVVDPYPRSPVIRGITWAPAATIVRQARDSDNWPLTWADDDHLYTAYGDGTGFPPKAPEKLSLGLARVEGGPEDFIGVNLRSPTGEQPRGDGPHGKKASGLLMVDGVLFMWVRNAANAQLAWSRDHARTWTWADWTLTTSFGCPSFLNFGKNYAGARDDYVYVYSHDSDTAYKPADRLVLARVLKDRIAVRSAYEFYRGRDSEGNPAWTSDVNARGAVFINPGRCYRTQVSYDAALKRYLLCQTGSDAGVRAGFGIYDAPEPWGPWTTVMRTDAWDVTAGESCSFPTKWMSADGKTLHLVFSGDDCFAVRKATLHLTAEQDATR
jgi:CubicO group peptidase (beta-lactamase class C family)